MKKEVNKNNHVFKNTKKIKIVSIFLGLFIFIFLILLLVSFSQDSSRIDYDYELASLKSSGESLGEEVYLIDLDSTINILLDNYEYEIKFAEFENSGEKYNIILEVDGRSHLFTEEESSKKIGILNISLVQLGVQEGEEYVGISLIHDKRFLLENCLDSTLISLWNSAFETDSGGVVIEKDNPYDSTCIYFMKKTLGDEAFLITGSYSTFFSDIYVFESLYLTGDVSIIEDVDDLNLTESYKFIRDIMNDTYLDSIYDRKINNGNAAADEFSRVYRIDNSSKMRLETIEDYSQSIYSFERGTFMNQYSINEIGFVAEEKIIDSYTNYFIENLINDNNCEDSELTVRGSLYNEGEILDSEKISEEGKGHVLDATHAEITLDSGIELPVTLNEEYYINYGRAIISQIGFFGLGNLDNFIVISYTYLDEHCNGDSVVEYLCSAEDYKVEYECPRGCDSGRCLAYECSDSDSRDNFVKGYVSFSDVEVELYEKDFYYDFEEEYNESYGIRVNSEDEVILIIGNELQTVNKGQSYEYLSGEIFVKNIYYFGDSNEANRIILVFNKSSDYCINNEELVEFSCEEDYGPYFENYYCSYGCIDGACQACVPSWQCGSWSSCSSGIKTRICLDNNYCNTDAEKPSESESCTNPVDDGGDDGGGSGGGGGGSNDDELDIILPTQTNPVINKTYILETFPGINDIVISEIDNQEFSISKFNGKIEWYLDGVLIGENYNLLLIGNLTEGEYEVKVEVMNATLQDSKIWRVIVQKGNKALKKGINPIFYVLIIVGICIIILLFLIIYYSHNNPKKYSNKSIS